MGISQLEKIEKIIRLRRSKARYLREKLGKVKNIILPREKEGTRAVYQMFTVRVKGGRGERNALQNYLAARGISSRIYFKPVHLTPFYEKKFGCKPGDLPVTERISGEVLTLPLYPDMTQAETDRIIRAIRGFFNE